MNQKQEELKKQEFNQLWDIIQRMQREISEHKALVKLHLSIHNELKDDQQEKKHNRKQRILIDLANSQKVAVNCPS